MQRALGDTTYYHHKSSGKDRYVAQGDQASACETRTRNAEPEPPHPVQFGSYGDKPSAGTAELLAILEQYLISRFGAKQAKRLMRIWSGFYLKLKGKMPYHPDSELMRMRTVFNLTADGSSRMIKIKDTCGGRVVVVIVDRGTFRQQRHAR